MFGKSVWSIPAFMLEKEFLSIFSHPARLKALVLLEQRAASPGEIAKVVGLTPSATLYHVGRLRDAGLIEQVDSRRARAFEEGIWRAKTKGWARLQKLLVELDERVRAAP